MVTHSPKGLLDGAYVKDNEALMKMKMYSREQNNGGSLEDFIDDLIRLVGPGYPSSRVEEVAMARDKIEISARSAYVYIQSRLYIQCRSVVYP